MSFNSTVPAPIWTSNWSTSILLRKKFTPLIFGVKIYKNFFRGDSNVNIDIGFVRFYFTEKK
eukprot:UN00623